MSITIGGARLRRLALTTTIAIAAPRPRHRLGPPAAVVSITEAAATATR